MTRSPPPSDPSPGLVGAGRKLLRLVGGGREVLGVAALTALAQTLLLAPVALLVRRVFDHSLPTHDSAEVVRVAAAILVLYVAASALALLSRRLAVRITKRAVARVRARLIDRLFSLPRSWHEAQDPGVVHSVVVVDGERLDVLLTILTHSVVPAVLVACGLAVVGIVVSPLLSAVVLLTVASFALVTRALAMRLRRLGRAWHRAFTQFSAGVRVALRAMSLTQSRGAERWEVERRANEVDALAELAGRAGSAQADYAAAVGVLAGLTGTLILVVGGTQVSSGHMSLGDLIAFYAIGALVLRQLAVAAPANAGAQAGAESLLRIEELLSIEFAQPYSGTKVVEPRGAVELRGVTFGYGPAPVVADVDLEVQSGEHVALMGPSGSGKSTLVCLVIGLYAPDAGQILFDGTPLDEIDVTVLRQRIGIVLQDPVILPGTIAGNIAYGSSGAGRDEIEAAARAAGAEAFVEALPAGYETEVGDEGVRLSGGERQRIAVARALVGAPPLLILDEPTTYLDQEAIVTLMYTLDSLPWSPTVLIVTHDPMVAEHADRIVQLRGGRVVGEAPGGLAGARLAT